MARRKGGDQLPEYFECWNSRLHIRRRSVCFLIDISLLRKLPPPPKPFGVVVDGDIDVVCGVKGIKYLIGLDVRVAAAGGVGGCW